MPTRQEVYAAIDSELLAPIWQRATVDERLMDLKRSLHYAIREASNRDEYALHVVRCLAATCVACMQQHGSFVRNPDGSRGPGYFPAGSRELVYDLIDSERDYQNNLPDTRTDGGQHTVCGFLCMFDTYLRRAIDGWTNNPGTDEALDNIRKLAGICVHCMEKHGAPLRG